MSKQGDRPIIGVFIGALNDFVSAHKAGNYYELFRYLRIYGRLMKKDDREKISNDLDTLQKYLVKIKSVKGRNYNQTLTLQAREGAKIYWNGGEDVEDHIINQLYSGGYISLKDFRPATRRDNFFE